MNKHAYHFIQSLLHEMQLQVHFRSVLDRFGPESLQAGQASAVLHLACSA